jgi:hypothetical protein
LNNITKETIRLYKSLVKNFLRTCNQEIFIGDDERGVRGGGGGLPNIEIKGPFPLKEWYVMLTLKSNPKSRIFEDLVVVYHYYFNTLTPT